MRWCIKGKWMASLKTSKVIQFISSTGATISGTRAVTLLGVISWIMQHHLEPLFTTGNTSSHESLPNRGEAINELEFRTFGVNLSNMDQLINLSADDIINQKLSLGLLWAQTNLDKSLQGWKSEWEWRTCSTALKVNAVVIALSDTESN